MEYINRTIENTIDKYIGIYPVIMITGPRQVGKTTLLNHLATKEKEKINYITLDDMLIRTKANEDPELFLRTHEPPLIIDEFQYAPNLLSYIKIIVDEARKNEMFGSKKKVGTLYYLTGSQVFQTMKNVSDSLAGRIGIFDLYAFSNREINKEKEEIFIPNIEKLKLKTPSKKLPTLKLFEKILKGGYPEIHFGNKVNYENYYSNYIRTYIERDIRSIINIKDENKFVKFISSLAARTAQELSSSAIANDIGIDHKTIDEWISILKNTGIIYLLKPHMNNNVGRAIKKPKMYFMDTGLACYLTGYTNAETLEKSAYSGAIFETYIINEIIKSFSNHGIDHQKHLYYYRRTWRPQ
ncbi:MAG: ATP-binding protein [Bacilli bacterium]|nr:ATP-binding protein [Bacilli bacterium]